MLVYATQITVTNDNHTPMGKIEVNDGSAEELIGLLKSFNRTDLAILVNTVMFFDDACKNAAEINQLLEIAIIQTV